MTLGVHVCTWTLRVQVQGMTQGGVFMCPGAQTDNASLVALRIKMLCLLCCACSGIGQVQESTTYVRIPGVQAQGVTLGVEVHGMTPQESMCVEESRRTGRDFFDCAALENT